MTLHFHDTLPSTQDEAHRLAAAGAPHGTTVAARVQTAGRGTRGREWVSGAGGLWLSVVCRPRAGSAVEVTGVRVGLALADFLDSFLLPPARIELKWPNDLLLGGGKLGGVLAEARWQGETLNWIVVGVGLNVSNPLPQGVTAARLCDAGAAATAEQLTEPVARLVAAAARSAAPLDPAERAAFTARESR